jgi:hypothetical protein
MLAATSTQLSALLAHARGRVHWSASAGSITAGGLFTAPPAPPPGRFVTVSASYPGASTATVAVRVLPQSSPLAAPAAPLPPAAGQAAGTGGRAVPAGGALLSRPQAELFNGELLVSTLVGGAGRVQVSASSTAHTVGGCSVSTPGHLEVTCRVSLRGRPILTSLKITVRLSAAGRTLASRSVSGTIPAMKMVMGLPLGATTKASPLDFLCAPSLAKHAALRVETG